MLPHIYMEGHLPLKLLMRTQCKLLPFCFILVYCFLCLQEKMSFSFSTLSNFATASVKQTNSIASESSHKIPFILVPEHLSVFQDFAAVLEATVASMLILYCCWLAVISAIFVTSVMQHKLLLGCFYQLLLLLAITCCKGKISIYMSYKLFH